MQGSGHVSTIMLSVNHDGAIPRYCHKERQYQDITRYFYTDLYRALA